MCRANDTGTSLNEVSFFGFTCVVLGVCFGYNFDGKTSTCRELKTLGDISADGDDSRTMTSQISFANGDPCDSLNILTDYHRPGFDYKVVRDVTDIKDCCNMCIADANICRSWGYDSIYTTCYLKSIVPLLRSWSTKNMLHTGLGCASADA
eukprot:g8103.t1